MMNPPPIRKITWALTGVWVLSFTLLRNFGRTPSMDIATATLVQPTITLKTTWMALRRMPMIIRKIMAGLLVRTEASVLNHGAMGMLAELKEAAESQPCPTVLTRA